MPVRAQFDEQYYRRFYLDPETRVADERSVHRLGSFVAAYLRYVNLNVNRVLDAGCGIGLWKKVVAEHFPEARYDGIEVSPWLCATYGWEHASVVDFQPSRAYDLAICQGVLPYLSDEDAAKAIDNLGAICRGALYLEAVSREDWDRVVDTRVTDREQHLREADWYRERLKAHFVHAGCGVWLHKSAGTMLFALERA